VPTLAWDRAVATAEAHAAGHLPAVDAEYGERRGPDLLAEARAVVASIGRARP
jgi:hypothetical protein